MADQTASRDHVQAQMDRACNYYANRNRAASAIVAAGDPHFVGGLVHACRIVAAGNWLAGGHFAGSVREQVATHFALRSGEVMDGLQAASRVGLENSRTYALALHGYGDTALLLALRHKRLFTIARDIRGLADGSRPLPPVDGLRQVDRADP